MWSDLAYISVRESGGREGRRVRGRTGRTGRTGRGRGRGRVYWCENPRWGQRKTSNNSEVKWIKSSFVFSSSRDLLWYKICTQNANSRLQNTKPGLSTGTLNGPRGTCLGACISYLGIVLAFYNGKSVTMFAEYLFPGHLVKVSDSPSD